MEEYRDSKGRFKKEYSKEQVPIEERIKLMYSIQEGWKKRKDYIGDLKEKYPRIFNSWRAILYTEKGKKAGCSEEWKSFKVFLNDVLPSYQEGLVFRRLDTSKPFSKENFIWIKSSEEALLKDRLATLTYKGETLPLYMWADKYNLSKYGIRNRYFKYRDIYTVEEIIFGKKIKRGSKAIQDQLEHQKKRAKASKMLSSYRHKDYINGFDKCDYTIEEMIEISNKPCVYCGDTNRIGLDRIDNNKGHTKDNTVPCCYECNCARNNNFTHEEMLLLGKTIAEIKKSRNIK
jgi:hypothetical protein